MVENVYSVHIHMNNNKYATYGLAYRKSKFITCFVATQMESVPLFTSKVTLRLCHTWSIASMENKLKGRDLFRTGIDN